jgi:putative transposase
LTFQFIADHHAQWPVAWMCEALEVSQSGYYAWIGRSPSPAAQRRKELVAAIQGIHAEVKRRYGSPRMTVELKARGYACSENLVAKLMKTQGIRAKTTRRFQRTTDSRHDLPVAENLLDRQFNPNSPNTAWSADISYIPTMDGWLYLAVVEDLFSRRIVGWAMNATMTSRLVVDALEMAIGQRLPGKGLMAHSDRGSQYASEHYQRLLSRHGINCSMSRVAQCWDNAPVESFFATLKRELIHSDRYMTREQARTSIFEYIEVFYNRIRRHSSLDYLSPVEFERTHKPKLP